MRYLALLCVFVASSASAQTTGGQKSADVARWIVAGVAVAADAVECRHATDHRTRCYATLSIRQGVAQAASIGLAHAFPRLRPCAPSCGLDSPDNDIPSRHMATTASTFPLPSAGLGPRVVVAMTGTVLVGILSGKATKHDAVGVLTGAAVGYAASFIR